jgi:DNA-binding CsgD family transcriptional regulator/tetratricopeptide (TPR) repeat protein
MPHLIASTPGLIDRADETAVLNAALERAAEGRPGLVVVTGEVGIGKSSLVSAFAAHSGARLLAGSCFPVAGESTPYAPVIQSFRDLGRALGEEEQTLVDWCWPHELARLGRGRPRPPSVEGPATQSGQARLFESVLSTLSELAAPVPGRAASPPLLVAWEDLHWADRSTLDLISFLVRNLRDERVLIVLTLRSDEPVRDARLQDWYAELVRLPQVTTVSLHRLDHAQTAEHLSQLMARPLSAEDVERVYRRTDGNPLFTEQALPWVLDQAAMPSSLSELLEARLAALPPSTRRLLEVVAVLGGEPTVNLVGAVVGKTVPDVETGLRPAVERRLLSLGVHGATSFAHPLLGEILDAALLPADRRQLHADAARELTARAAGDDGETLAGRIAHHWQAAGSVRLAFESSIAAGLAAEALYAFAEADEHFSRVLVLRAEIETDPANGDPFADVAVDPVDVLMHAAQAAHLLGDGARAADLADRAAEECADPSRRAGVLERKGQICINAGMPVEAEAAYDAALDLLPATTRSETRVRAMAGRALLMIAWSRFDEAEGASRDALALSTEWGFPRETGRALTALGLVLALRGDPDEGADLLLRALELAYKVADPDDLGTTIINTGHVLGMAGRHDEAVEVCTVGYEALRRVGLARQDGAFVRANAVDSLIRSGRWVEAEAQARTAVDHRPRGLRAFPVLKASTQIALMRGDLDEARRRAAGLDALAADHQMPDAWSREHREVTAALAWWEGRPDEALGIARTGLEAIARSGEQVYAARLGALAARALGDIAERDGRHVDVAGLLGQLRSFKPDPLDLDAGTLPDSQAWSSTLIAELSRAQRASDPVAWARTVAAWEEASDVFFLLYARWRHAEALVMRKTPGATTVGAVREAYTSARELGATLVAAEVEKLARWARVELAAEPDPAATADPGADYALTAREREVLAGLVAGRTNRELAEAMFISVKTASVHVSNILRKLDVANREEAARVGARLGL